MSCLCTAHVLLTTYLLSTYDSPPKVRSHHGLGATLGGHTPTLTLTLTLTKVRSHHGLGATLGGHTRATDAFLLARDEAARLARPLPNWHAPWP